MSVKNGYVSLNANADEKKLQEAGVYYNADVNSAYINFEFDETIDLSDSDYGYCILELNGKILQLDLNVIDNANQAFIVLPADYMSHQGEIYGEVYLRYPQNSLMVGRFSSMIKDTLAVESTDEIANAYVPKYEEIQNQYNDLKSQFESLGLGTFEESVKKVNDVIALFNQYSDAIKGLVSADKPWLNDQDANNLPEGVYELNNLQNAPSSMTGHVIHSLTTGGWNGRKQTVLLDSTTGQVWYKSFGSREAGEPDTEWMKVQAECVLWENNSGNTFSTPVQLDKGIDAYRKIAVEASLNGNRHTFYAGVPRNDPSTTNVPICITNVYDDGTALQIAESKLVFKSTTTAQLTIPRNVIIRNSNNIEFSTNNEIKIFKITGVI